ncbi:MAG: hypothetical protein IME96_05050 [Proteobacteria bacterium]|nr:hypothetical protein [Pseudomonadota bacterium]
MTRLFILIYSMFLILTVSTSASAVTVDWEIKKTLNIGSPPIDIASSADGKLTFILASDGTVLIYSSAGQLQDKISVGKSVDSIEVSPGGDQLFLSSKKNKTVQIVGLDFINQVNIAGSPYKGSADASIVIAVFSDFQ